MFSRLSRSELLSTFFPTWIWQGREWAKGRIPKYDPYFWINAHAHPVISTFYPPQILSSWWGAKQRNLDVSFRIICGFIYAHILLCLVGWFTLILSFASPLIALFGAITFSLSAYNWKQQPCFIYTIAWFPWLLLGISSNNLPLSAMSFGMVLLAGYYPIGIQIVLISLLATIAWGSSLLWLPIGVLIGLPQLVPFLRYLPKTIRTHKVSSLGKVPWWHPFSLLTPKLFRSNFGGVGYWEMSYYVGLIPLFLAFSSSSRAVWLLVCSYLLMLGFMSHKLPRIPARWCFTFQFAIGWMAVNGLNNLHLTERVLVCLIMVQTFDLIWNNSDLIPTLPYSELPKKPSLAFSNPLTKYLKENLREDERVSGLPYPLFTGHINQIRTLGYSGGMQLKLMAKFRNDKNPDGNGSHDWFKDNDDDSKLTEYRVRFAYSRKKPDRWLPTPIRHLYRNPAL